MSGASVGRTLSRDVKATISVGLSTDLVDALNDYCRRLGVTRSAAVEVAVRRFILAERGKHA